jgi:hypothetical protein
MKKLFFAATIALAMAFTATLHAADTPQNNVDVEKMALEFEKKAEEDSKNELKGLVLDEVLKKDIAAARGQREGTQGDEKKEGATPPSSN